MHAGRVIVYLFAGACLVALAASLWLGVTKRGEARENQSILGLRQIHEKAQRWSREHDGDYPDHIARLLTWTSVATIDFTDPREPDDSVWAIGEFNARELPLSGDETPAALDARASLDAAIEANDPPPTYRFGDFFFAQLDQPTGDGRIVFGWTLAGENGRRFMMFDDGKGRRIERDDWPIVWDTDAATRKAIGLPPMKRPSFD